MFERPLTPGGRFRFVGIDDATVDALPQATYAEWLVAAVKRAAELAVVCEACGEPLDDGIACCTTCAAIAKGKTR